MVAPGGRFTRVVGADIGIVTIQGFAGHAQAPLAVVAYRAGIVVLTGPTRWRVNAPFPRVAGINGTDVLVVTIHRVAGDTISVGTHVGPGAGIAVVALPPYRLVLAAHQRVTTVICTIIAVVTVESLPPDAISVGTNLRVSARVAIVTRIAVVGRQGLACPIGRIAHRLDAGVHQGIAADHGIAIHLALKLYAALVAIEGPVTQIAIFVLLAV